MNTLATTPRERSPGSWLIALTQSRESSLALVLILVILATALANPRFVSPQNIRDMALNVSIIALLTTGLTTVMLMRHIDLSISSVVGLSAFLVGDLYTHFPDTSMPVAIGLGLAIGCLAGAVNGCLVTWGQVPSLVATIVTGLLLLSSVLVPNLLTRWRQAQLHREAVKTSALPLPPS